LYKVESAVEQVPEVSCHGREADVLKAEEQLELPGSQRKKV
jgi:hypothetical protein